MGVTHVQKNFLIWASILAVIDKISNFHEIAPNFTFPQISEFFKYICNFLDQLLYPYKFYGRGLSGILFFIFASCEPLTPLDSNISTQTSIKYPLKVKLIIINLPLTWLMYSALHQWIADSNTFFTGKPPLLFEMIIYWFFLKNVTFYLTKKLETRCK